MQSIINFSIKNKLAIWIVTIFITVFGLYSANNMKMEQLPNINEPIVNIQTIYPGASPEEILKKVTEPVEQQVLNLEGVKNVISSSLQDASSIQVEYGFDKDLEEAEREIENSIKGLALPEAAQTPEVARLNFNDLPILVLSVTDSKESVEQLGNMVQEKIKPEFEKVQGISKVNVIGNGKREVKVSFLTEKMEELQIQQQDVFSYLKSISGETPLGVKVVNQEEKILSINNEINSISELEKIEIPTNSSMGNEELEGDSSIALKDIAEIKIVESAASISRYNGKDSIGIQIHQGVNGDTVEIVDELKEKMDKLEETHASLTFSSVLNSGDPIKDSIKMMLSKALMGAAFAILIILLFLRDIKSTIIAVISIPLSLVIAVILLNQMDITLNLMTLGAMTVAIGRVVDDSIVVIENIYRKMRLSEKSWTGTTLIKTATMEMFSPIMSSTIVTIAVFFPLGLIDGPVGELFYPFGLTIVFALLASLIVSITIVPMMAHMMLRNKKASHTQKSKGQTYHKILTWTLNHKVITFVMANVLLLGSLFLIPAVGVTFIPEDENNLLIVTYDPKAGDTRDEINNQVKQAENYLLGRKHIELVQSSQGGGNPLNPADTRQVLFFIKYKSSMNNFSKEQETITKALKDSSKGEWGFQDTTSGNNQMNIFVYGEDFTTINETIEKIEQVLSKEKEVANIKSSSSIMLQKLIFQLNTDEMASRGILPNQIYEKLSGGIQDSLTTFKIDGEDIPVNVQLGSSLETQQAYLEQKVPTILNEQVSIDEIVNIKEQQAPDSVSKRNGKQFGEITAVVKSEDVGSTITDIEDEINSMSFANGIEVDFGGVSDQINESFNQLLIAVLIAIMVVFFVLVVTFGGGLAPLAILFSLPYAIIGSLVGLLITNEPISISVMIGALMLIGIVVTNAIVLVDRIIQKEKEGVSLRESILEAGATRLRPILMTAFATVGALMPLVYTGESDGIGLISRGLGVTVIGGLISSTLLTLVLVPVVYEAFMKMKRKVIKNERISKTEEGDIEA